eukprot:735227-Prorocentrum_lima.AAC.1
MGTRIVHGNTRCRTRTTRGASLDALQPTLQAKASTRSTNAIGGSLYLKAVRSQAPKQRSQAVNRTSIGFVPGVEA